MRVSKKRTLSGAADAVRFLYHRMSGKCSRLLQEYLLDIGQTRDTAQILRAASKALKIMLNYELCGLAMKSGASYDVWIDQSLQQDALLAVVENDFPGERSRFSVHPLDADDALESRQNYGGRSQEQMVSYLIVNEMVLARLYLLPRRGMFFEQGHLMTIVRSLGLALESAIRFKEAENAVGFDPLTNCYNRRAFTRHVENSIAVAQRFDRSLSVMLISLDDLAGTINASGRGMGEQVLRDAAALIASSVRRSDCLARFGGGEFALLLPETGLSQANEVADKLRNRIAGMAVDCGGGRAGVAATFGVAELRKDMNASAFLHEADIMLRRSRYQARHLPAQLADRRPMRPPFGPGVPALQCS
jgi:diguanylate cyclase (GGDEF)-like protein